MCDYSLHADPTRLAEEGEQLVAHRFPTCSMGLASPRDLEVPETAPETGGPRPRWWSWSAIMDWLNAPNPGSKRVAAVCVPPGARLMVRDIPKDLQNELGVGPEEEVVFVQQGASENTYRDGVRFQNGRQILLQRLREGQRVDILTLAGSEPDGEAPLTHEEEEFIRRS